MEATEEEIEKKRELLLKDTSQGHSHYLPSLMSTNQNHVLLRDCQRKVYMGGIDQIIITVNESV